MQNCNIGGRVLCATSYGEIFREAVENSILMLEDISFEGMYYAQISGMSSNQKDLSADNP
jgi:phosphoribosylamine-glycine ligase